MYAVAVRREVTASHFMVGGDFGAEGLPHPHRYLVEWRLEGRKLDRFGFIADIDRVAALLEETLSRLQGRTLNALAEFEGLNPSIENLARVLWEKLARGLTAPGIERTRVTVWESDSAWAAYEAEPGCASL